jgi:hypothetical protein
MTKKRSFLFCMVGVDFHPVLAVLVGKETFSLGKASLVSRSFERIQPHLAN